jgi:hypothetical protein
MTQRVLDHYANFDETTKNLKTELLINFDEIPFNSIFNRNYTVELKGKKHVYIKN